MLQYRASNFGNVPKSCHIVERERKKRYQHCMLIAKYRYITVCGCIKFIKQLTYISDIRKNLAVILLSQ